MGRAEARGICLVPLILSSSREGTNQPRFLRSTMGGSRYGGSLVDCQRFFMVSINGIRFHPENGDFHWDFIWVDKL